MNSKATWRWFLVAATLYAIIGVTRYQWSARTPAAFQGWPQFPFAKATRVQIIPKAALEIQADRTNDHWVLAKPIDYPAQAAGINALLKALEKVTPVTRITASELRIQPNAEAEYGFDNPLLSLVIDAKDQRWQLKVGRLTAPGDQVFLRVVGVDGAFVTSSKWLQYLPESPADWRDTGLLTVAAAYDAIVLTNGAKVIELHQNLTNHLWRMTRPLAARADSDRINQALQQLVAGKVTAFVTDDPRVDLAAYELQPANLDLWLGHGGAWTDGLHLGKTLTNNAAQVFARREGWNGVVTTLQDPLAPWHGSVNDFRDRHLVDAAATVQEIELAVADGSDHFILQKSAAGAWRLAGEKFPVDAESVSTFLKLLGGLKASDFVSDAVTAPDLKNYGLTQPLVQIVFRATAGDTNLPLETLSFSAPQTNGVFARRSDEDFIYGLDPERFKHIPLAAFEFRDRRVWNLNEADMTQITVSQGGQTRQFQHVARNQWNFPAGTAGVVVGPAVEETAHRLGDLVAAGWAWPDVTVPSLFGVTTNSLQITITMKGGQTYALNFGLPIDGQPSALVDLQGEKWALVVPVSLYEYIAHYLTPYLDNP